jgi:hypothetical protein
MLLSFGVYLKKRRGVKANIVATPARIEVAAFAPSPVYICVVKSGNAAATRVLDRLSADTADDA